MLIYMGMDVHCSCCRYDDTLSKIPIPKSLRYCNADWHLKNMLFDLKKLCVILRSVHMTTVQCFVDSKKYILYSVQSIYVYPVFFSKPISL